MSILSSETVVSTVLKVRLVLQRGHLQLMPEFCSSSGLRYGPSSNRGVASSSLFCHDTSSSSVFISNRLGSTLLDTASLHLDSHTSTPLTVIHIRRRQEAGLDRKKTVLEPGQALPSIWLIIDFHLHFAQPPTSRTTRFVPGLKLRRLTHRHFRFTITTSAERQTHAKTHTPVCRSHTDGLAAKTNVRTGQIKSARQLFTSILHFAVASENSLTNRYNLHTSLLPLAAHSWYIGFPAGTGTLWQVAFEWQECHGFPLNFCPRCAEGLYWRSSTVLNASLHQNPAEAPQHFK